MESRGELSTLGGATVPVAPWLAQVMQHVEGQTIAALCLDRYKQAEIGEGIDKAGIRAPIVWRGMGFRDGGEDCERFRRSEEHTSELQSLMRISYAVFCLKKKIYNRKSIEARQ